MQTFKKEIAEKEIGKAKVLIETLPYIKKFYDKTVVVKYGGSIFNHKELQESIVQNIALMKLVGMKPVIVHGGGAEINKFLEKLSIKSDFVDGQRVTTKETIEIVEMVLAGKISKDIVKSIHLQELKAVGVSGKDGGALLCEKKLINGKDYGYIGEIKQVDSSLIKTLIDNDFIPVISPIGFDKQGNSYNINADYATLEIAKSLKAEKLVFLSDIEGILKDINDPKSVISNISIEEIPDYINSGIISGGMLPKILSCKNAVENGVNSVHILDGRLKHSLLLEIFTDHGTGTMIGA